ncbi:MAG: Abi family protein [Bacilli bacterium]|nr:Abi family protein [Bacilli bacterium]
MTKEEFWNSIIISDEEKQKSLFYLKYRGIDEHNYVRLFLESRTGRKVTYSEIASTFRYDKRIRRVIYKFIGILEESIRAYVANKYTNNLDQVEWIGQIKNEQRELFNRLDELTLGQLFNQIKKLKEDRKYLFDYLENDGNWINKDFEAIIELRNQISHNRFILNNMKLKECSIGDGNGSLWANLLNLKRFLPNEVKQKFCDEVNNCAICFGKKYDYQVCGDVPVEIIINI